MTARAADSPRRPDRRRARTHALLLRAGLAILAAQGSEVSIQAITDEAGVAHGSFYNYFRTKQELFSAAVTTALDSIDRRIAEQVATIPSPVERLAVTVRSYGRLPETDPVVARVIGSSRDLIVGPAARFMPSLQPVAESIVAARGRPVADLPARILVMTGGVAWLIASRTADSTIGPDAADELAAVCLEMIGVPAGDANEICARSLPAPVT